MDPLASSTRPTSDPNYGSSSRVRVEYTDPSGVFSQIGPELQVRLPLRNLNWNSQSRPLRSIDSLFVELKPDQASSLSRPASSAGADDAAVGRSESPVPKQERRHQIPGLRSTPYLRIYLLRCDDSDTYKATSRKQVREWIKSHSNAPKKSSKAGQENHDAFEWLIIHAAPVDGSSSWPTKAMSSVLDKLRSDFNTSSKTSVDRVVQIPFAGDFQVQGATSDAIPAGPARDQFIRDSNRAWETLIARFKTLILMSFDQRVRQYEDDIKEKGAQRSIPGWNFCTFFMFKEGLAIGFENVGLLDDALLGYDELNIELLTAIRTEIEKVATGEDATLFRDFTQDLLDQGEAAWSGKSISPRKGKSSKLSTSFLDVEEKPYRELIMATNISVFDFRCYVFVRQMAVLLRIANSLSAKALHSSDRAAADPSMLAEICRRALSFIASTSRTVRQDLQSSFKSKIDSEESFARTRHDIIENIVSSWTFGTAQQILAQTEDAALSKEVDQLYGSSGDQDNRRFSSIPAIAASSTPKDQSARGTTRSQSIGPTRASIEERSGAPTAQSNQRKAALVSLAFRRGELVSISRKALKSIGERAGWDYPVGSSHGPDREEMDEVDLNNPGNGAKTPVEGGPSAKHFIESLLSETLRNAVSSEKAFYKAYEDLSWQAHNLFQYSEDENSVHALLADIATLKFRLKDYAVAASYFHQLAPFYAEHNWTELEIAVLDRYAWCLKELGRKEEYVRIALKLLGRCTSVGLIGSESRLSIPSATKKSLQYHLRQVLETSKSFQEPLKTPLRNYFLDLDIDHQITHTPDADGFNIGLSFTHALVDSIEADAIKVQLAGTGETHAREVNLATDAPVEIKHGKNRVLITSKALFPGRYYVECVSIYAAGVIFQYQPTPPETNDGLSRPPGADRGLNSEHIVLWPRAEALHITAFPQAHINLEEARSAQFEIKTGSLNIKSAMLHVKAGSAGLRMHTAEAKIVDGECEIEDSSQPSAVKLGSISAEQTVHLSIPYQLDTDLQDIQFRSEISYSTEQRDFVTGDNHGFSVNLPLGVNVQDIFQESALFSKFSITTSTSVPLRISDCRVDNTPDFTATTPYQDPEGLPVFFKQPVSMVYRIVRASEPSPEQLDAHLVMHISYRCLDEEITAAVLAQLATSLKEDSSVQAYFPLLSSHLRLALKERLPRRDLTTIGLLREVALGTYADCAWDRALAAIVPADRSRVQSWLAEWHTAHSTILLDSSALTAAPLRQITIPVDVPPMPVVHTARLALVPQTTHPHVGTPLTATLHLRHTVLWAQPASPSARSLHFIYELDVPPDTWLLGGPRRRAFRAMPGEDITFDLLLIPLRAGRLLLPGLDVRFAERDEDGTGAENGAAAGEGDEAERTCEIDYLSQGVTVLVVPGVGSVSAGLGFEAAAPGGEGESGERKLGFGQSWVLATEGYGE